MTDPGAGYDTPPRAEVAGLPGVRLEVRPAFSRDLTKNGGVAAVVVTKP